MEQSDGSRKIYEETLIQSVTQFQNQKRALDEHSIVSIASLDKNVSGEIVYVNDAFCEVTQFTRDEIIGKHHNLLRSDYHNIDFFRDLWKTVQSGIVWRGTIKDKKKNGGFFWADTTVVPFLDAHGHVEEYVMIRTNITELVEAREELKHAIKLSEAANQAKSRFLANMSHEIRTPMNGIIGMTAMLLKSPLTERQKHYLDTINHSANNLLILINEILDFSKIEAGKYLIENAEFALCTIIEGVIQILSQAVSGKKIEFGSIIEPGTPLALKGDQKAVHQILLNLVGNAVKFTEKGHVFLRVSSPKTTDEKVCIRFAVEDTGIGMSADTCLHVFNSFYQADASTTRKYGGTGIGLNISQELASLMGSKIEVNSTTGEGSVFHFEIEFEKATHAFCMQNQVEQFVDIKVLVVDPNSDSREIICSHIQNYKMICNIATSGEKGIQAIINSYQQNQPFQLVICTSSMPDMDIVTFFDKLHQQFDDIPPIIPILPWGEEINESWMQKMNIHTFLTKPITRDQLYQAVRNVLINNNGNLSENKEDDVIGDTYDATILVVDDNQVNRDVTKYLLEYLGCDTAMANDGEQAINEVKNNHYDLVLMDCHMPNVDGFEATQTIRKWEKEHNYKPIPIVALTASVLFESRDTCFESGMDDYLSKPVIETALLQVLQKWIPERIKKRSANIIEEIEETEKNKEPNLIENSFESSADETLNAEDLLQLKKISSKNYSHVLSLCFDDIPKFRQQLKSDLESGNKKAVINTIHAIKGNYGSVGARNLSELCKKFKLKSNTHELGDLADLLLDIETEMVFVGMEIEKEMEKDSNI